LLHFLEVNAVFSDGELWEGKPMPYYDYEGLGEGKWKFSFGAVSSSFNVFYESFMLRFSSLFPYLPSPNVSLGDVSRFIVYLFQRLICFACTDDIIMFSGICFVLDHLLDVLVFILETLSSLVVMFWG